jgi:serine/threonine-protein kinase
LTDGKKVLGGRYELEETLGEGGMASVYRGTDRVLGRTVAVKVLASRYARDAAFVARFRREAQAAAKLNHPGVVSVYDTGSDDGTHYIVMEHVAGPSGPWRSRKQSRERSRSLTRRASSTATSSPETS